MELAKEHLDLEKIEWGEFIIGEIFDFVMRGKRLIERDRIKGNIPYYSASKENNGLSDMIGNPLFVQKDKLIISTFCDCYFVEGEFTASDEITIFGNKKLNKYNALFIASIIKSQATKYAFGRKAFSERLIKQKILLPITSQNQPDFAFMESFMKDLESKHLQKILSYYAYKLQNSKRGGGNISFDLSEYKDFVRACHIKPLGEISQMSLRGSKAIEASARSTDPHLQIHKTTSQNLDCHENSYEFSRNDEDTSASFQYSNIKWREFNFSQIFTKIGRGKRLIKQKHIEGKTPYVSSSGVNNAVDNFIDNDLNVRKFEDCITLANSGSVESAFYHQYEFIGSDHITALKNPKFNKYIYLYLLPIITRLSEKYSFNREVNDSRIKREKLILPATSQNKPDFAFMESCMRELEQKHLSTILRYYQQITKH